MKIMSLKVDIRKKLKAYTLDVSFETEGDYLGLLGASGSGKSMTLKCIAGIETPDEGTIVLNGRTLFDSARKINLKPQERNIGYFFQNYALFPHMTVEDNITAGLVCSKADKSRKAAELMKSFHLQGLEKKYPNQLSGGEQQRVALARCLIYKPDVLMLDEPFSALDLHLKEKLQGEVLEMLKDYQGEVLMVTHSRDEAYKFCRNLAIIDQGRVVVSGDTKELFRQPGTLAAARLTGCKNISACTVLSAGRLLAGDWGLELETARPIPEGITHIGIWAHNLRISDNPDEANRMECRILRIEEEVFEYAIVVRNKKVEAAGGEPEILFKTKKEDWDSIPAAEPLFLKFPEEAILFLE